MLKQALIVTVVSLLAGCGAQGELSSQSQATQDVPCFTTMDLLECYSACDLADETSNCSGLCNLHPACAPEDGGNEYSPGSPATSSATLVEFVPKFAGGGGGGGSWGPPAASSSTTQYCVGQHVLNRGDYNTVVSKSKYMGWYGKTNRCTAKGEIAGVCAVGLAIPGVGQVEAVGLLALGLAAYSTYAVVKLCNPSYQVQCPPLPPNPAPQIDGGHCHWPCGDPHLHTFTYHQGPWPLCMRSKRRGTVCLLSFQKFTNCKGRSWINDPRVPM